MKTTASTRTTWLLLIHQLPPRPTNLRVRAWRKLQKLGAVALKNSVYVLPFNEKSHEDLQWLKEEIQSSGGEATLLRADSIERATEQDIVELFRRDRDEAYLRLAAQVDGLTGSLRQQRRGGHLSAARLAGYEAELEKFHSELERIMTIDFFQAPRRGAAQAAYERAQKALVGTARQFDERKSPSRNAGRDLAQYQARRWVTRRRPHIDRLASAWLIKRFVDARPRFAFVGEGETVASGIPFDMFGVEFGHRGENCTFETLLQEFGLRKDAALAGIAEIVHDIDLKDAKFNRSEAAGLNAVVRGLAEKVKNDQKLVQQALTIFDGLYESLQGTEKVAKGQPHGKKKKRRTAGHARKS